MIQADRDGRESVDEKAAIGDREDDRWPLACVLGMGDDSYRY